MITKRYNNYLALGADSPVNAKRPPNAIMFALLLAVTMHFGAEGAVVRYVDVNNTNPAPPYISWSTAATNIQDAVDAAISGDQILVTNGIYQTGGKAVFGSMTNRVAADKAVAIQSVNGPTFTTIQGYQVPGTITGDGAVRCVYLTNGAGLSGFTLAHGATRAMGDSTNDQSGGGIWCASNSAVVSNCVITGNSARWGGGGAYNATLDNCVLTFNSTISYGAGALYCKLSNCSLSNNSSDIYGGGASACILTNCVLMQNSAQSGGGTMGSTLENCILIGNSALGPGGGSCGGTLNSCVLKANLAQGSGGGVCFATLNNCLLTSNSAAVWGGGAFASTLRNCTLARNSASQEGGGACGYEGMPSCLTNCIVYNNSAAISGNNFFKSTLSSCCTTPMPTNGVGNITKQPLFIDLAGGNLHLQPNSPCIDAGTNLSSVITNDLDGRPRPLDGNADGVAAFDMGAYEHSVLFVRQDNPSPAPPYNNWATAATNIQDAADLTLNDAADQILVTNGVYQFGGNEFSRVLLDKTSTSVRSINGPRSTVIDGGGTVRCVSMADGTLLSGFTLTNGVTAGWGGGVAFLGSHSDAVVSNCVIIGNSANSAGGAGCAWRSGGYLPVGGSLINCFLSSNSATGSYPQGVGGAADNCTLIACTLTGNFASDGGGASASRLTNCLVTGNRAFGLGGGTYWSWLYNCVVSSNSAGAGATFSSTLVNCTLTANPNGGAYDGWLTNCIVYDNGGGWNQMAARLSYCCTTPLPGSGIGNFTNAPMLVDPIAGNCRLQSGSPCINTGDSTAAPGITDLDGRPRIVSGTVDIGAYEFQPGVSGEFIGWLSQFGLPTDGSADHSDSDADGMSNWAEWITGTVPTDALSALRLFSPTKGASGVAVSWESVNNRTYFLERAANLGVPADFSLLTSNIVGQATTTSFTDTNATDPGPFFYRVGVHQ